MHELLYVCTTNVYQVYAPFISDAVQKHYSQFLNLQLHRFIIQPSLCYCIYFDEIEKQIVNEGGGVGCNGQKHAWGVKTYPQMSKYKFLHYSII